MANARFSAGTEAAAPITPTIITQPHMSAVDEAFSGLQVMRDQRECGSRARTGRRGDSGGRADQPSPSGCSPV